MPTPCEDLATKAELQELRDQLNAVLGAKENGSQQTLFAKNKTTALMIADTASTLLGMAQTNAPNAIMGITATGGSGSTLNDYMQDLMDWEWFKGNGTKVKIPEFKNLGKVVGKAGKSIKTGAKVSKFGAASTLLLGELVLVGGTLYLNKKTVDVLDQRIDAEATGTTVQIDALQSGVQALHQKHQGQINNIYAELESRAQIIANQQASIETARSNISDLQRVNQEQDFQIDSIYGNVLDLKNANESLINEINDLDADLGVVKADLTQSYNEVKSQLDKAIEIIESQKAQIAEINAQISVLEQKVADQGERIAQLEEYQSSLTALIADLANDLQAIKDLHPEFSTENATEESIDYDKITYYESYADTYDRLVREGDKPYSSIIRNELESEREQRIATWDKAAAEHRQKVRAGGGSATAAEVGGRSRADGINLAGVISGTTGTNVTKDDVLNDPTYWDEVFNNHLENIRTNGVGRVTPNDIENIKREVGVEVSTIIGGAVLPELNKITANTSQTAVQTAVESGICNSVNGGSSCPAIPGGGVPKQGLKGSFDNLNDLLTGASFMQNSLMAQAVNRIDQTVHHARYGLQTIQSFAESAQNFAKTAWEATHADKVLNAMSLVIALHNAAMLSRNLGETLGELTSQALATIGIKDAEGSPLDINGAIGQSINSMLTSILGAEVYQGIKSTWNKSSRILSSASSIVWTVRSIADSTREITEWTAENTGKIGNALKRWRVVGENAYNWMPERMTTQNKWLARVERARNGVDSLDDAASSLSSVLGEVQSIEQETAELMEQGNKFKQNIKDIEPKEREQNTPTQLARQLEREASKAPSTQADTFRGEGEPQ